MEQREKTIYRTTLIGTAVNAGLIILKFFAGTAGHSAAMIADAVHSFSDFVTDLIVLVFVRIAGKPQDTGHDYGHGKFETFATMIIGLLLLMVGAGIFIDGIRSVVAGLQGTVLPRPSAVVPVIAAVSIVSKELLYRYTVRQGTACRSGALTANAWHHRSDAASSVGTLVGVGGAMVLGERWRILDPVAAILVSLFIAKAGYGILKPSIDELLDSSLPEQTEREICGIIGSVPGVKGMHNLRTRRLGNAIAIDVHVKMEGSITLTEAHAIASETERRLRERYGRGTMIGIHMEPHAETA